MSRIERAFRRWGPTVLLAASPLIVAGLFLGPDLFLAIPWALRKGLGWCGFVALGALGLGRIATVRTGDLASWPSRRGEGGGPGRAGRAEVWLPWVLGLATLSMGWPLLRNPENLGFGDWDYYLQKWEAIRRTILVWGEFPWWDPWCRGGVPLASSPQVGLVSIATPLVLICGTSVGLRLATVLMLVLAVEGARRLAEDCVEDPWAAALAGLVYGLNGGVLVETVGGYFIPMSYATLPWLIRGVIGLERSVGRGLALGGWGAFIALNGLHYLSIYGLILAGLIWLRSARLLDLAGRRRLLAHSLVALGLALALSGWRLGTMAGVMGDFPRVLRPGGDETWADIAAHLLVRPVGPLLGDLETLPPYFWETTCYVGPLVLLAASASLARGWRWWHLLGLGCGWLAIGGTHWYHPSYWLAHLPVFSTMHAITRWRFPAMLGLGLATASAVAHWRAEGRLPRWLATALVLAVGFDYLDFGHRTLQQAFPIAPTEAAFPGPRTPDFASIREWPGFAALLRDRAVVHGYEPLLGYQRRAPTARLWQGHPDYVAEFWTGTTPLKPAAWAPNRVVLHVKPGEQVAINQNPGSWWSINGAAGDPNLRCVEMRRPFRARADGQGRLELRIRPRGLILGYQIHAAGLATLMLGLGLARIWRPAELSAVGSGGRRALAGGVG